MNKKDFKNPLIQSGALLLFAFLLISIVAGSGSEGIWGSVAALISGLVSAVVFVIALCFAIVISIAVIIGIYVAAVSIYSVDKGRDLIDQLKSTLVSLSSKVPIPKRERSEASSDSAAPATVPQAPPAPSSAAVAPAASRTAEPIHSTLQQTIEEFGRQLSALSRTAAAHGEHLTALQKQLDAYSGTADGAARIAALEETQQSIETQVHDAAAKLDSSLSAIRKLEQQYGEEQGKLKAELAALHEKTSVPDVISGILSYIDTPEDRDTVTEKAKEAIARNMTYSQIDDFFKDSLPPGVYKELAAHPRLTKDFLRSIKKKF